MKLRHRHPLPRTIVGPDGLPYLRRNLREALFRDFYYQLAAIRWPLLLALLGAAFVAVNLLFASAYFFDHGLMSVRAPDFSEAFLFSIQAMSTVGSLTAIPVTLLANVLFTAETLSGLLLLALVAGLAFARFSRPTALVRFSRHAVVADRDGIPSLMFRMANVRQNRILEAEIRVTFIRTDMTREGESIRRFDDLELVRNHNALFALTWTAIHPIDAHSPLRGMTPDALRAREAVIVVSLTGLDETLVQTVPARHIYRAEDLRFGVRFQDVMKPMDDGLGWVVDASLFDELMKSPLHCC
jgi:inward rectifier potassium channel